jgi:DNA-binding NtrC family response regulator
MALQRIADPMGESLILVLSDINMPGMTGLELLPKAKALRPGVPVIMITAYGDADTKRTAVEKGAETLLTKPIDFAAPFAAKSTCVSSAPLKGRSPTLVSAFGPKQTSGCASHMSAFDPKRTLILYLRG